MKQATGTCCDAVGGSDRPDIVFGIMAKRDLPRHKPSWTIIIVARCRRDANRRPCARAMLYDLGVLDHVSMAIMNLPTTLIP